MNMRHIVGIDVGGTNTDTVVIQVTHNQIPKVIQKHKVPSQEHFVLSICAALKSIQYDGKISSVMVGTTFFLNSLIQRKNLAKVCLLRLAGRSGHSVPPYTNWPQDLRQSIEGYTDYGLEGGYFYDGTQMGQINQQQVREAANNAIKQGITSFAVVGVFSPLRKQQEIQVGQIIKELLPQGFISLSHELGNLGIVERQNATILNASLCPIATQSINQLKSILPQQMKLFLTQNNGTIIESQICAKWPIKTFASGVTNSMVGASFLTGIKNAVVIDIGGTTTDIGIIKNNRPKLQYANINLIDEIRTHMPMPACKSMGIGGGTIVRNTEIGPDSLGSRFLTDSLSYGGSTLALTDIWASLNKDKAFGTKQVQLDPVYAQSILSEVNRRISTGIQNLLESSEQIPLIITGGGSILFDVNQKIPGISHIIKPQNHDVCNAIGSALCNVSGNIDMIIDMKDYENHDSMLNSLKEKTISVCVSNGAIKQSIELTDVDQIPLGYIPGHDKRRVSMTAIGKINADNLLSFDLNKNIFEQELKNVPEKVKQQSLSIDYVHKAKTINLKKQKPTFDVEGRWIVDEVDIEYIAFGAAILGSGGGGDAFLWKNWCFETLRKNPNSMKVISPLHLNKQASIVQVGFAGSPAVGIEYLANGDEFVRGLNAMQQIVHPQEIGGVATAQIGGGNGLMGLIAGSMKSLPVVDVDAMGRAFPRLDNAIQFIHKQQCSPTTIFSIMGKNMVFDKKDSTPYDLENHVRQGLMKLGCIVGICFPPLSYEQVQKYTIHNSLSFAWRIGAARYNNPLNSINAIADQTKGKVAIKQAKVQFVQRKNEGGFSKGTVILKDSQNEYVLVFQNQNLLLKTTGQNGKVIGITPEIIIVVQQGTGTPITTELIRYGLIVSVLVIPSPQRMAEEIALKSVGPEAFGIKQSLSFENVRSINYPSVWDLNK